MVDILIMKRKHQESPYTYEQWWTSRMFLPSFYSHAVPLILASTCSLGGPICWAWIWSKQKVFTPPHTRECFQEPEKDFYEWKDTYSEKDAWKNWNRSQKIYVEITEPRRHIYHDLDHRPLEGAFIFWKHKSTSCSLDSIFLLSAPHPQLCFPRSTHWEGRCHWPEHRKSSTAPLCNINYVP